MSGYSIRLVGNEETDTFPWAVVNSAGGVVDRFTHRAVADQYADRLNFGHHIESIYDVDEIDEMLWSKETPR